jgi:Phytanoyl-CoA dioxygenase (PhyH)
LDELTAAHFHEHGWLRVPGAFDQIAAEAMRTTVWRALAETGIERNRPSTWPIERPVHLQRLKDDPVFAAVGSARLLAAIANLLDGGGGDPPANWGALFVAFPSAAPWHIPSKGWHADANYRAPVSPARGVRSFALLGDVEAKGGGTLFLSGSHRLIHNWFRENPPPADARSADLRRLLLAHPYLRDLHAEGDPAERAARFMERNEIWGGVRLRVIEQTGRAGDVLLAHPLLLHVAAPNNGAQPRFLLSGGVTRDMWGWST